MMSVLHTKKDTRVLSQGANFDSSTEFIGNGESGEYVDAENLHYDNANLDAPKKIGGEGLLYDALLNTCHYTAPFSALANATTYDCIGSTDMFLEDDKSDHHIEFWASSLGNTVAPAFMRIDGIIVLMSPDFPITYNHPLQLDTNPNCLGGEIYITDYNVEPMIFNIADIMINGHLLKDDSGNFICTEKYFSGFNIDDYIIQLLGDNNHPIFIGLSSTLPVGAEAVGSGGLDYGLYQYQIRKVTNQGDATAWSKATPLIPVIVQLNSASSQYPYTKTFGANANPNVGGGLGIHIRFRIDNTGNYDYLQIKRTKYNTGLPSDVGAEFLLDYRIQLGANDLYVKDVWDNGANELALPNDANLNIFGTIKRAKTLRYYQSKLVYMNVEFQSRNLQGQVAFSEINGKKMFPVIHKMTTHTRKDGHKNPYNFAYYKSYLSGEKYGYGIEFRDGNSQVSFAMPMGQNIANTENYNDYQYPNRRDTCADETIQYSNATVKAASVDGATAPSNSSPVTQTHEVFDHYDAIGKSPYSAGDFNQVTDINQGPNYKPLRPTGQADSNTSGHAHLINDQVSDSNIASQNWKNYNPEAFGLDYYAHGMALSGVTTIPATIKSFSIVRTQPAKRVVTQGLAYYNMGNATSQQNSKQRNGFLFHSPDVVNGFVNINDIVDSIQRGETRYQMQAVSPLGFFTELYGYANSHGPSGNFIDNSLNATAVDMMTYCRILREKGDINVGDVPTNDGNSFGVGLDSKYSSSPPPFTFDGYGYTGYGKWRAHRLPQSGTAYPNAGNGNRLFPISGINFVGGAGSVSERGQDTVLMQVLLSGNIFDYDVPRNGYLASPSDYHQWAFNNDPTRFWHEPMYIVNIVDTLADVPQPNIQSYIETEHYQKIESLIGKTQGVAKESFVCVDERSEDFMKTTSNPNADKIIFTSIGGVEKVWLNVTGFTSFQIASAVSSIFAGTLTVTFNGVSKTVDGVFTTTTTLLTDIYSQTTVIFDTALNPNSSIYPASIFQPDTGSQVLIRYDTSEPCQSFGGESTTHEAVFLPYDLSFSQFANPRYNNFYITIPFPYLGFKTQAGYRIPRDIDSGPFTSGITWVDGDSALFKQYNGTYGEQSAKLRQIAAMYTCESRTCLPYSFEPSRGPSDRYFPATNYVFRPVIWDATKSPTAQVFPMFSQYVADFPNEEILWFYGGFKYQASINQDYSAQQNLRIAVSAPKVGFREQTLFCTGVIWSLTRPVNVQDAAGLRTFPATNFYALSDDTGDIKYAYMDYIEGKGMNLFPVTEEAIWVLITDKTILYGASGNQLAQIGNTDATFITNSDLMFRVGMNDETWRSAAEGFNVIQGDLSQRRIPALFFTNLESAYRFSGGNLFDIARGSKYFSRLRPQIDLIQPQYGSKLAGVYDVLHDEYWANIHTQDIRKGTFVYGEKKSHYLGTYDYSFDKFTSFSGKTFGMRNAQTYLMNQYGQQINASDIQGRLIAVSAKGQESKEFSRIRIASNLKPDRVIFYNTKANYQSATDPATINTVAVPLALKNYNAWESFIPRKDLAARNRVQGREVVFVIEKVGNDAFQITTAEVGYLPLKGS